MTNLAAEFGSVVFVVSSLENIKVDTLISKFFDWPEAELGSWRAKYFWYANAGRVD